MKLGTIVKLPDGRIGTVVYNSLIGVGVKWGQHYPTPEDFEGTNGDTTEQEAREGWEWEPEALLRDSWEGCENYGFKPADCVGGQFEVIRDELGT